MRATQVHLPLGLSSTCLHSNPNNLACGSTLVAVPFNPINHRFRRLPAPPVQVTNQGKEMRVAKLLEEAGLTEDEYIILDPDNPAPNPEFGPLERRVSTTFEEGLVQEEIDPEAMKYWFTEPEQGWNTEKRRLKKAPVIATDDIDEFRHENREGRRPLSDFKVGDILRGKVVKQMLHHGLQIDIGAEVDGLIWISELEAWQRMGNSAPGIDDTLEVVVHAVRDDPIFRFPLQLMPTDAQLVSKLPNPDDHLSPLDLRDVRVADMPDIAKRSGRKWAPTKVIVKPRDGTGEGAPEKLVLSEEEMLKMDDFAAGIF